MKNILKTILISSIMAFLVVSFVNNINPNSPIGATITTLSGTDNLTAFPSSYNTNLANLNVSKIEISTTTLPFLTTLANLVTVGTITTGTWNADTLTVAYGGTGSTTLSLNQVLLGNGTGNINIVAGLGSNGQFLTSGGAGTPPTWTTSSLALGDNYTWTGLHIFNGGLTTSNATSTDHNFTNIPTYSSDNINLSITASSTTFTLSGTYTKSANAVKIFVQAWGGGGSGGTFGSSANDVSAGGGGGMYIEKWFDAGDVGATETVTVGTGGAAKTSQGDGNDGNDTTFGSLLTAGSGKGGGSATSGAVNGGDGGSLQSLNGVIYGTGGSGDNPGNTGLFSGGGGGANTNGQNGGNSIWGGAGGGGMYEDGSGFGDGGVSEHGGNGGAGRGGGGGGGIAGTVPGGGGGGGNNGDSGAGADGQIIVTEFF